MTDALTALDATFLELEQFDEGALMSIGGVMVFDPLPDGTVPSVEEVQAHVASRLAVLPRYSQRLSDTHAGGLAWPHWTDDERFDIRAHVRHAALPSPGRDDDLCAWAADFYSHRLDRTRPLWEMVLIEGIGGGRWALAHKTHHCLVDGVGSVDVAGVLLDADPKADLPQRLPPAPRSGEPTVRSIVPHLPAPVAQATAAGMRAAHAGLGAARHPRDALSRSRALTELIVRDEIIPAPHTSLNVPIGPTRRFAIVRVPLGELQEIRNGLGGSINDVVLSACTAGLRDLLLERGERLPLRGLRAMVPVNVRSAAQTLSLGNRISSLFVELPVVEPDPAVRHAKLVATTQRLKASGAASGAAAVIDLAALAPPVLHGVIARSLYATRLFNVTITNVPGSQGPLYALGARLREVHPVVPLAADHAVGVAVFSYDGLVTFGVIADSESTPDIDVLAYGIEQGIEALLQLSRRGTAQPQAK